MTVILLIRHGHTAWIGRGVPGRLPNVPLTEQGRTEVEDLARRLSGIKVRAIYTSPMDRTRETARMLSERLAAPMEVSEPLIELEVGNWAGKNFAELDLLPEWKEYKYRRTAFRAPGIEPFDEVQQRAVKEIERLRTQHENQTVALVSHGDVIKAAVMYYIGMPLDWHYRIEVGTASVSILTFHNDEPRLVLLNDTGSAPLLPGD